MTTTIFIDGAAGTTGLEIRQRLADRGEFHQIVLDEVKRKDPAARREALNDCDVAILCLPDDAAAEAVAMVSSDSTRIIDASSVHRVASGWTYGFPELVGRSAVAEATRIANPGCYPTGFLAMVAPLVRAGLTSADWPYTVNAVSGYSGGGNALIGRFERDRSIAWRGYGLAMGHKHLGEMKHYADLLHTPLFAPAVVDTHRGMFVEVPLPIAAMQITAKPSEMHATLAEFYSGSKVVSVKGLNSEQSELLLQKDAKPWDGMALHLFVDEASSQVRLIAQLDNLGKGASGAAVQSLNLMLGLPEETGLSLGD